ncbi:MAG: C45 family peptidase [Clostridia bacterium]|nr:C45 family peptidase [Clostridia bacterium]
MGYKGFVRKIVSAVMIVALFCTLLSGCKKESFGLKEIDKYFYEAGTYTSLDYDFVNDYFAKNNDNWGGGCSAVSADINGTRLVGRNMDLNISNKCAYYVKTDVPHKYETIGLAYTFRDISPDYETVKKKGLGETFEKVLPFMCDDVVNSKGLHIEINMRSAEKDANGNDLFSVEHTNANADERIYVFTLGQYIALNCKDLDDVKAYLENDVDVYNQQGYWNYSFIVTDAAGNSALLEFGNGKYYWVEPDENGVVAQTNFYVNEECNKLQDTKLGLGRYDTLKKGIGDVENASDLYELMKKVSYSWFYAGYDTCKNEHFDPISEVIGEDMGLDIPMTYDSVMASENEKKIADAINEESKLVKALSRPEQQDLNMIWESSFTEIINPKAKTIQVRLFENESMLYEISFDGVKKITKIS